jgi:hypothetical protein
LCVTDSKSVDRKEKKIIITNRYYKNKHEILLLQGIFTLFYFNVHVH